MANSNEISKELKRIKKKYGEEFMHLCRTLFPTILEEPGTLSEILNSSFAGNTRSLYQDIIKANKKADFNTFIYSKFYMENYQTKIGIENITPYELLDKAGYVLTECRTEEEIQSFKKYYKEGEELCTFDGDRLDSCVVFWAVKKDAENIKRENFQHPERQDEYGTSVMSIQFNREGLCTVSIKNRYNHTVSNPDATYGNNLDKIIPGLAKSFENLLKERGLELSRKNIDKINIPGYVRADDGKYYRFNREINGIYYCPGNIVIKNGQAEKLPPNKELIDYFIVDSQSKTVELYDPKIKDSFIDGFLDLKEMDTTEKKIDIRRNDENNGRIISISKKGSENPIEIEIDDMNRIIGYKNFELTQIGDKFLCKNKILKKIEIPNVVRIGNNFLVMNDSLTKLNMPNLIETGDKFLFRNEVLEEFNAQNLRKTGKNFLRNNTFKVCEFPNVIEVGDEFMGNNRTLIQLKMPKLIQAGDNFLGNNAVLEVLETPKLQNVLGRFLSSNVSLKEWEISDSKNLETIVKTFETYHENFKVRRPQLKYINPKNIAELDQSNGITTSEVNCAKQILENVKKEKEVDEK